MIAGDVLWAVAVLRSYRQSGQSSWTKRLLILFALLMAGSLLAMLVSRSVGIRLEAWIPTPLLILVFVWHFIGLPVALMTGFLHQTSRAISGLRTRKRPDEPILPENAPVPGLSRREFFARIAVATPAVVAVGGGISAVGALDEFRIRKLIVPIRDLPSGIDGLSIAHVSDTHLGRFTTAQTLKRMASAVNDLDADLILQTGDLINNDQNDLPAAAEFVRSLRSKHGQYLCEGNHDLIGGRASFERFMRSEKLPMLVDEIAGVRINGVDVDFIGLSWFRAPRDGSLDDLMRTRVKTLASSRSHYAFPILLAHHPHAFDAARSAGIPLTLSGHTHGGQLNAIPGVNIGKLMYRYWSGLYERDGQCAVVSNGAGNWFPLRINAPAEILHLTLRRA
jgi:uncharacterized protein